MTHRMLLGDFTTNKKKSAYSISSRIPRTAGGLFFRPGWGAFLVTVFAFLEQVWETGSFKELKTNKKDNFFIDSYLLGDQ